MKLANGEGWARFTGDHDVSGWCLRILALGMALASIACGPYFSNELGLLGGDGAIALAPKANFQLELERLKPAGFKYKAVIDAGDRQKSTITAEWV